MSLSAEQLKPLIRENESGIFLSCHIQPGASRNAISGIYGTSLKITLAAPPVDGKANRELCLYLAKKMNLPKRAVSLVSGQTSREKVVFLSGFFFSDLVEALK